MAVIPTFSSIDFSNQTQVVANDKPPHLERLKSVFNRGICSPFALTQDSVSFQQGYDSTLSKAVYCNAVGTPDKLNTVLFDKADGIYHISTEYAGDEELVKRISNEARVNEIFSQSISKVPFANQNVYSGILKECAFVSALPENTDLLNLLSSRSHKVAVLILSGIDLTPNEKEALSVAEGFSFFEREAIESQKIKFVLMSENLKDAEEIKQIKSNHPNVEFQFASGSSQEKVPFSWKEKKESFQKTHNIEVNINAPNFLPQLTEIYNQYFAKRNEPMIIHAMRL